MSSRHERVADAAILLSAAGVTGTLAEMAARAEQLLDQPDQYAALNERICRQFGADLDAAA